MDIHDRLDNLARLLETARAVPLSTSCVVPRNEVLDMLEEARAALPDAVKEADDVLAQREDLLDDAHREADDSLRAAEEEAQQLVVVSRQDSDTIIDQARSDADDMLARARNEARRMIDEQEVLIQAQEEAQLLIDDAEVRSRAIVEANQAEADRLIDEARADTSRERVQTDEFVDGKLADLEESLATSLAAVRRGRDKIQARRSAFDPVDVRDGTGVDLGLYDARR